MELNSKLFANFARLSYQIMRFYVILAILMVASAGIGLHAQVPTISPSVRFVDAEGNESSDLQFSGSAPVQAEFRLNPSGTEGWNCHYEWRFFCEGKLNEHYLTRYEENTDYIFSQSGIHYVVCYATFVQGRDTVAYTQDYWQEARFSVSIYESKLEFPNAFSPNGDGINDIYRAKSGYQSIVEFRAIIFNRWGQKLYEWNDPAGGWDGTYKGKDVKQGVYYCLVKARGADGRKFELKKDVNLLRDYIESTNY